ncbi:MAG TPA: alpha/beta hydrolase [Burkholderiales bacterium]|nr:alpha/beta hydrolase [Burkholderiales bacterium]
MNLPDIEHAADIAYRQSGKARARDVVLLHGIGSTSAVWRAQFATLGEHYRVVAWSAPGYHDSLPLPGESPPASAYADALARLLDAVGVSEADFVTNSWGTLCALAFASSYPKRVRSLVLGGPTVGAHGLSPEQREKLAAERIARVRSVGLARMREQDAPRLVAASATPDAVDWAKRGVPGEAPSAEGYCQAARMLYATDGVALIAPLPHPVLVISGTEDVVTPPEKNAKRLAEAARNGQLAMIDACGHLPHVEQPGRFNALVLDFLEGR